jgi:hypothetical protein
MQVAYSTLIYNNFSSLSLQHYANAEYLITKSLAKKLSRNMNFGSCIVELLSTILMFPTLGGDLKLSNASPQGNSLHILYITVAFNFGQIDPSFGVSYLILVY